MYGHSVSGHETSHRANTTSICRSPDKRGLWSIGSDSSYLAIARPSRTWRAASRVGSRGPLAQVIKLGLRLQSSVQPGQYYSLKNTLRHQPLPAASKTAPHSVFRFPRSAAVSVSAITLLCPPDQASRIRHPYFHRAHACKFLE
jgi:hypothetical protein